MWFSPLLCANVHVLHVLRGSFVGPSFKATAHFDMNTHLVFEGEYIKSLEAIKNMIAKEFLRMPNANPSQYPWLQIRHSYLVTFSMTMGKVLPSFLRVKNSIKPC
jgi:hypothetical protein